MLCKFGCGREAIYKDRCDESWNRCPINRKKNSSSSGGASERTKKAHRDHPESWKGKTGFWNKGLTKETDDRVRRSRETLSKNIAEGKTIPTWLGKKLSDKHRNNISLGMQKAVAEGRQKTLKPGGICKTYKLKNCDAQEFTLQGSWELKFAKQCNENRVHWVKNKVGFKYLFEGKERTYFPDFYLKEIDQYVEIKGYETDKDKAKWKQFPLKLKVLKRKDLELLDILLGASSSSSGASVS